MTDTLRPTTPSRPGAWHRLPPQSAAVARWAWHSARVGSRSAEAANASRKHRVRAAKTGAGEGEVLRTRALSKLNKAVRAITFTPQWPRPGTSRRSPASAASCVTWWCGPVSCPHVDRPRRVPHEDVRQAEALATSKGPPSVQSQTKMHDRGAPVLMLMFGPEALLLAAGVHENQLPARP